MRDIWCNTCQAQSETATVHIHHRGGGRPEPWAVCEQCRNDDYEPLSLCDHCHDQIPEDHEGDSCPHCEEPI